MNSTHGRIRQIPSIFSTKSGFFGAKFGVRKNRYKKTATTFFVTVRCENRFFILVYQVKRAPTKAFYRHYPRQFRAIFICAENIIFLTLPRKILGSKLYYFNRRLFFMPKHRVRITVFLISSRQYTTDTNMYLLGSFSHFLRNSSTSEKLQRVINGETVILSPASAFTAAGILSP